MRRAARDASRLEDLGFPAVSALGLLNRGGVLAARRDDGAMAGFQAAEEECRRADMWLHAAVARRRRGQLLGGDEGRALIADADAWMAGEGVKNPERMCAALAPFTPA